MIQRVWLIWNGGVCGRGPGNLGFIFSIHIKIEGFGSLFFKLASMCFVTFREIINRFPLLPLVNM